MGVKALPIILGLPFTFLLFWMCQGLLIVCQEEAGEYKVDRKNFSTFLLNLEPMSFLAMLCPFLPLGSVSSKTWGGPVQLWYVGWGSAWLTMIIFICLGAADTAFPWAIGQMAVEDFDAAPHVPAAGGNQAGDAKVSAPEDNDKGAYEEEL